MEVDIHRQGTLLTKGNITFEIEQLFLSVDEVSIQVKTGVKVVPVGFNGEGTDGIVVDGDILNPQVLGMYHRTLQHLPHINITIDGTGKLRYVECCKDVCQLSVVEEDPYIFCLIFRCNALDTQQQHVFFPQSEVIDGDPLLAIGDDCIVHIHPLTIEHKVGGVYPDIGGKLIGFITQEIH